VALTSEQRATLRSWLAAGKTERRLAFRAQIILALAEGLSNAAVAGRLVTRPATVSKWRGCFARRGVAGLADAPRSGKPRHYEAKDEQRVLAALDTPPPVGFARWNGTLLAKHLGNISKHQIWRVLREHEISLERRRSWCISTDPAFAQKAADIVALYLQPPENAVVLSVDEKPHIQALERAQGWLKLRQGAHRLQPRIQTPWHDDLVCGAGRRHRPGQSRPLPAPPARRVLALHQPRRSRTSGPRDPCHLGQSEHS
jgi:transposase